MLVYLRMVRAGTPVDSRSRWLGDLRGIVLGVSQRSGEQPGFVWQGQRAVSAPGRLAALLLRRLRPDDGGGGEG